MPIASIPSTSQRANNDRLKKALAQRAPPPLPQISTLPDISFPPSQSCRRTSDTFDDLVVDPHHASIATFATYSSSNSSSSSESTDSMLFSTIASTSNTIASSIFPVTSASVPESPSAAEKLVNEPLSFLDSSVPPITSTPTQFNIQRMKLAESLPNSNTLSSPATSSNTSVASTTSHTSTSRSEQNIDLRIHKHNSSNASNNYSPYKTNNLMSSPSSSEYGKFGKIVAGSIHSVSSLDSADSSGKLVSSMAGPRRLFEKSKGTVYIKNDRAPPTTFTTNLNNSSNTIPKSQKSHQTQPIQADSQFHTQQPNSTKTSITTINNNSDSVELLEDAFNPSLYTESASDVNNTRNLYSNSRVPFTLGSGYNSSNAKHDLSGMPSKNTHTGTRLFGGFEDIAPTSQGFPRFNDPTDLSDAFMNLHTDDSLNNMPLARLGRRSSFHVIDSSDFGYTTNLEDKENKEKEERNPGFANESAPRSTSFKTVSRHRRSNSAVSDSSRSSVHLSLDIDLDQVIHNALVESAVIPKTNANKSFESKFQKNQSFPAITSTTSNSNKKQYKKDASLSTNQCNNLLSSHYEFELLNSTSDINDFNSKYNNNRFNPDQFNDYEDGSNLWASSSSSSSQHNNNSNHYNNNNNDNNDASANSKHNAFGKFKKLALKMTNNGGAN